MQLAFSAATAGSVGRAQTQVRAAGLLADGACWIAGGAFRADLFPHRSLRRMQLKVVRQRARANKGYDKGQGLRVPRREPLGAVIGTTRPCMELGSHTPFETWLGMKASWRLVKKGWFFIAGDHDGIRATKSRAGGAMRPFRTYGFIGFAARRLRRQCRECVLTNELRQRPYRRAADQRASVIQ